MRRVPPVFIPSFNLLVNNIIQLTEWVRHEISNAVVLGDRVYSLFPKDSSPRKGLEQKVLRILITNNSLTTIMSSILDMYDTLGIILLGNHPTWEDTLSNGLRF